MMGRKKHTKKIRVQHNGVSARARPRQNPQAQLSSLGKLCTTARLINAAIAQAAFTWGG